MGRRHRGRGFPPEGQPYCLRALGTAFAPEMAIHMQNLVDTALKGISGQLSGLFINRPR